MWKSFTQTKGDPAIYLKVDIFDDPKDPTGAPEDRLRYDVSVTNYIKMWNRVYNGKEIIEIMLESNAGTECDDKQGFLHAGLRMMHNPKLVDNKTFVETPDGKLNVELICMGPIVLKMNFTLLPCSVEHFFKSITRPLLVVINDQMLSENKLRQQLVKKDQEICGFLDMLPEKSPLMRCLKTTPYNDMEHMATHGAMDKLFGTDPEQKVCPRQIILYGRPLPVKPDETASTHPGTSGAPTTHDIIKNEPDNVKSEQDNVKNEPEKDNQQQIEEANKDKILNKDSSVLDKIKIEPDDDNKSQIEETNNVKIPDKDIDDYKNEPGNNNQAQTEQANIDKMETAKDPSEHDLNKKNPDRSIHSPEAKPDAQKSECTTPKKRRRNLNY